MMKEKHCQDLEIGDKVFVDGNPYNLRCFGLPGYLSGQRLTVIGFTRRRVKCDWDGGKPFNIPPSLLEKKQ